MKNLAAFILIHQHKSFFYVVFSSRMLSREFSHEELLDVAKLINETRNFRLTNYREIMIGTIPFSMAFLDESTCDDIVLLIKGLTRIIQPRKRFQSSCLGCRKGSFKDLQKPESLPNCNDDGAKVFADKTRWERNTATG